jgi:hypothetical protein
MPELDWAQPWPKNRNRLLTRHPGKQYWGNVAARRACGRRPTACSHEAEWLLNIVRTGSSLLVIPHESKQWHTRTLEMAVGVAVSPLTVSAFHGPHNTLAHFASDARKCLTGPRFGAKMPFVAARVMRPKAPP